MHQYRRGRLASKYKSTYNAVCNRLLNMDNIYFKRRYLISFAARQLPHIFTDVLVIGSGAAGLRAAIEASNYGQVILLAKCPLAESNTYYAQGGLAAALAPGDSVENHVKDTMRTGCGLCDEDVVRNVIAAAPQHIKQMQDWGVGFDSEDGEFMLGREGGHGESRIVHAGGDATGKALAEVLAEKVRRAENIKIFSDCFAIDLLTDPPAGGDNACCVGAITYNQRYGIQMILARQTILASGGTGSLWRETTNPPCATADGIAMGFRAGAAVADAEMMQFHPTTLYVAGATRALISEAVRGEGAYLKDREGRRFMEDYHEMGELAPRDIVSRAIYEQTGKTGFTHVFLDVRHIGGEKFAERFPQIDDICRSFGINPAADLIPVHPAAHYMIGGLKTDSDGRTGLEGLFACGETACTGLHGANRLASNSLTEALIFGQRCGELAGQAAAEESNKLTPRHMDFSNVQSQRTELDLADIRNSLRSLMWRNVGIERHGDRLKETLEIISFWGRYVLDKEFWARDGWEIQNMLTAAYIIGRCAQLRTESRGVHHRTDYPETDPKWATHQQLRRHEPVE